MATLVYGDWTWKGFQTFKKHPFTIEMQMDIKVLTIWDHLMKILLKQMGVVVKIPWNSVLTCNCCVVYLTIQFTNSASEWLIWLWHLTLDDKRPVSLYIKFNATSNTSSHNLNYMTRYGGSLARDEGCHSIWISFPETKCSMWASKVVILLRFCDLMQN